MFTVVIFPAEKCSLCRRLFWFQMKITTQYYHQLHKGSVLSISRSSSIEYDKPDPKLHARTRLMPAFSMFSGKWGHNWISKYTENTRDNYSYNALEIRSNTIWKEVFVLHTIWQQLTFDCANYHTLPTDKIRVAVDIGNNQSDFDSRRHGYKQSMTGFVWNKTKVSLF